MRIANEPALSHEQLMAEIDKGARLVHYTYVASFIFTSRVRTSRVYLLRNGESGRWEGLPHILFTLLFGWWAIPYGPRNTFRALRVNLSGGTDVTSEINDTVAGFLLFSEAESKKKAS